MGRFTRGLLILVASALLAAPVAGGATPTQIYRDFEDNRRLDGRYSIADLKTALRNPSVQGYGGPTIVPEMEREIRSQLGVGAAQAPTTPRLPFTGIDLALLTFGGGLLLALGLGLRRVARNKA
jgi:hypothetical protein